METDKQERIKARATLSVEEAAAILGIGRDLAYLLARTGGIPVLRLGPRRMVVPSAALQEMLGAAPGVAISSDR